MITGKATLPKIKDGISILYRVSNEIYEVNFLFNSSGSVLPFALNEVAFRCLQYIDGTNSIEQIKAKSGINIYEIEKLIEELKKANIICDTIVTATHNIPTRFSTQLNFFADFEAEISREEMQERLNSSHAMIVGLGGVGTWVAYGLALAGVGTLTLIDPDIIEEGNLNRQCLFTNSDIGMPKAETVAMKLSEISSTSKYHVFRKKITTSHECVTFAENTNIIINCADEPNTDKMNRVITEAGHAISIPHVLCGGYDGHLGFIGPTVIPGQSACWYCYEQSLDRQLNRAGYEQLMVTESHFKGGNIGAISAIVANYHTLEAIKVLSGFARPAMLNRAAELDFLTFDIHFRHFTAQHDCSICGRYI